MEIGMTIKRYLCVIALGICAVLIGARPAHAQLSFSYMVPQSLDPNVVVTFGTMNQRTVGGSDLVPKPDSDSVGIEIHSAVPGQNGGIRDITQLTVMFHYTGNDLKIEIHTTSGYAPWVIKSH